MNSLRKCLLLCCCGLFSWGTASAQYVVLEPEDLSHYVDRFNAEDEEAVVNLVPNRGAWDWMLQQVPLFECPATPMEEAYYFRWWTFRKHIKQTPQGRVITEFIEPVSNAGPYNTVSCAYGHHLAEGRWLRDRSLLDEYTHFWYRMGPDDGPQKHFHKFSSWAPAALYDRYLVSLDRDFLVDLLDDLVSDYRQWETERQRPDGMFWQHDVKDGMEESISGGRRQKNIRPTINSYMAANAQAVSRIAQLAGREELAEEYAAKYTKLHEQLAVRLWDPEAEFFKVRLEDGKFSTAREEIGFIPWMFDLAGPEHAVAWRQLIDRQGFNAPRGITTAERRHPEFRSHGVGTCEWDGAVWPFATSQTLGGLAKLLRGPEQTYVTRRHYFDQLLTYAESHQKDGRPYIGEYHDEITGKWLITGPKEKRSRFYNHSTFNDLVITGLVGLVPREDNTVEIDPLVPPECWDWFCLDRVPYHGHDLTILWDRHGTRYGKGSGLILFVDGKEIAHTEKLERLTAQLPQ